MIVPIWHHLLVFHQTCVTCVFSQHPHLEIPSFLFDLMLCLVGLLLLFSMQLCALCYIIPLGGLHSVLTSGCHEDP